jgi:hypothetical protein
MSTLHYVKPRHISKIYNAETNIKQERMNWLADQPIADNEPWPTSLESRLQELEKGAWTMEWQTLVKSLYYRFKIW